MDFGFKNIILAVTLFLCSIEDCSCCFKDSELSVEELVKVGENIYQECRCTLFEVPVTNLKWFDPSGKEVQPIGISSDVYTERSSNSVNLFITDINNALAGRYKCSVLHNGKLYERYYNVQAYAPLHFVNVIPNQSLIKGKDSEITCKAKGKTEPLITWYKEEDLISGNLPSLNEHSKDKYEKIESGIKVKQVTDADSGVYICSATVTDTGETNDNRIKVDVLTIPFITEIKATPSTSVKIYESLTLECLAGGVPVPKYTWTKKMDNVTTFLDFDSNKYHIKEIKASQRGEYECKVVNDAGIATKKINIEVVVPPVISRFYVPNATEGTIALMFCEAEGRPAPDITIEITTNDTSIVDDQSVRSTCSKLDNVRSRCVIDFANISRAYNSLEVTCNASNKAMSVTKSYAINVNYKPSFNITELKIWAWNGLEVNISCSCDANPPAQLEWRFIDSDSTVKILDQFKNTDYINLNFVENSKYGTFECLAKNDAGNAVKTIQLIQASVPPAMKNVSVIEGTATSITFSLECPENTHGPPIIGFTCEYDEAANYDVISTHPTRTWAVGRPFKIDNLKPNATYKFRFAALNEAGQGVWTEHYESQTPENVNITDFRSEPEQPKWTDDTLATAIKPIYPYDPIYAIQWEKPSENGVPIDYYILKHCPIMDNTNSSDYNSSCGETKLNSDTNKIFLRHYLEQNTTYYVQLVAHNAIGNSKEAILYLNTPIFHEYAVLSAEIIIGVTAVVVVICIIVMDLVLFFWRRQGMIASCFYRKNKKNRQDNTLSRDRKGLLKEIDPSASDTLKRPAQQSTGVITGKFSSV